MKTGIAHFRAYTEKTQFLMCIVCLTVAVLSILFSATCFGKSVVIDIDGKQNQMFVFAKDVEEVFSQAGISVCDEDKISSNLYDSVAHGQTIYVNKAFPVELHINGAQTEILTTASTVTEFLDENQIVLSAYDEVTPGLEASLSGGSQIVLSKAEIEFVTRTEEIPYKTVSVPNHQADRGTTAVKTEGENGVKEVSFMRVWRDGAVVEETPTQETIVKEPVNQVVEYGTVVASTGYRGGNVAREDLKSARMITMTATAYDLSYESCGKRPGDRGYGITASGMKARRGVVAVDRNVIPLGTKLYIETPDGSFVYGEAVAGDTGGAIKGNRIDLFMDTRAECMQFGRRKVNVYILD